MKEKHRVLEGTKGKMALGASGSATAPELPSLPLLLRCCFCSGSWTWRSMKLEGSCLKQLPQSCSSALQTLTPFLITETPQKYPYVKSKPLNIFKSSKMIGITYFSKPTKLYIFPKGRAGYRKFDLKDCYSSWQDSFCHLFSQTHNLMLMCLPGISP